MNLLEEFADWTCTLKREDIPPRVEEKVRHQVLSVLAAMMAGLQVQTGKKIMNAVPGSKNADDGFWAIPNGRSYTLEEALLVNCSLGMILDYDDYLFMGHTGHSAVTTSLLLADREQLSWSQFVPAILAANEIAGRLGAATIFGPRNGQLWSYIHLAAASTAVSRILGFGREITTHSLAVALYQPLLPLYPGFMGGECKVTTAATPTITGVQSAFLAQAGITGNPKLLEENQGFLEEFSPVPMNFFFSGWGKAWVSDTLIFKRFPGCAYVDAALDAWEDIQGQLQEDVGRSIKPEEVKEVVVEASILTAGMEELSRKYRDSTSLLPININFSVAYSLALAILNERVTPRSLDEEYLEKNKEDIVYLASKVRLIHDWESTVEVVKAVDESLDLSKVLAGYSFSQLKKVRRELKTTSQLPDLKLSPLLRLIRVGPSLKKLFQHLETRRRLKNNSIPPFDLGNVNLDEMRLPFGAKVHLYLQDGKQYSAYYHIPRGAPGGQTYLEEAKEKWYREAEPVLGEKKAEEICRLVLEEDFKAGELLDMLNIK